MDIFSIEGPVFNFLNKALDLFVLNILWILCCIPIITAGASTTAMYYVTLKAVKNEESHIARSFFRSFKENFVQATVIWLIALIAGGFLILDIYICRRGIFPGGNIFVYFIMVIFFLYLMALSYIFPALARFKNTLKASIKNAFLMSIAHMPYTVLILILSYAPLIVMLINLQTLLIGAFIYIFIGGSLTAYLNSYLFIKIFTRYIPVAEEESL